MFELMKEKLYTPVVGDILDQMGYNGDIVFGDVDGVLIIPRDVAPEVIERALEKASTEKTMRRAIEDGMLVTEAFAKFGVL